MRMQKKVVNDNLGKFKFSLDSIYVKIRNLSFSAGMLLNKLHFYERNTSKYTLRCCHSHDG